MYIQPRLSIVKDHINETSEKSGKGEKGFKKTPFLAFLALTLSRGCAWGTLPPPHRDPLL